MGDIVEIQDEVERVLRRCTVEDHVKVEEDKWKDQDKKVVLREVQAVFDEIPEEDQKLTMFKELPVPIDKKVAYEAIFAGATKTETGDTKSVKGKECKSNRKGGRCVGKKAQQKQQIATEATSEDELYDIGFLPHRRSSQVYGENSDVKVSVPDGEEGRDETVPGEESSGGTIPYADEENSDGEVRNEADIADKVVDGIVEYDGRINEYDGRIDETNVETTESEADGSSRRGSEKRRRRRKKKFTYNEPGKPSVEAVNMKCCREGTTGGPSPTGGSFGCADKRFVQSGSGYNGQQGIGNSGYCVDGPLGIGGPVGTSGSVNVGGGGPVGVGGQMNIGGGPVGVGGQMNIGGGPVGGGGPVCIVGPAGMGPGSFGPSVGGPLVANTLWLSDPSGHTVDLVGTTGSWYQGCSNNNWANIQDGGANNYRQDGGNYLPATGYYYHPLYSVQNTKW